MLFNNPNFIQNPYPFFDELRKKGEIYFDYDTNAWHVLSYKIASKILSNSNEFRLINDKKRESIADSESIFNKFLKFWFIYHDKDKHLKLRKTLGSHFNPSKISKLKQDIKSICKETIESLPKNSFDLRKQYSTKISVKALVNILGIISADESKIANLTNLIANFVGYIKDEKSVRLYTFGTTALYHYIKAILDKNQFTDSGVISSLVNLYEKEEISEDELIFNIIFFFTAGVEEPSSGLTNCFVQLSKNPNEKLNFINNPEHQNDYIDELMRMESSIQFLSRTNIVDVEIEGKKICKGAQFILLVNAINYDPSIYEDPEKLDFNRPKNRNITFGEGIHFCLGYYLTKLQIEVGLNTLLAHKNELKIDEEPDWLPRFGLRAYKKLMVSFK